MKHKCPICGNELFPPATPSAVPEDIAQKARKILRCICGAAFPRDEIDFEDIRPVIDWVVSAAPAPAGEKEGA